MAEVAGKYQRKKELLYGVIFHKRQVMELGLIYYYRISVHWTDILVKRNCVAEITSQSKTKLCRTRPNFTPSYKKSYHDP